MHGTGHGTVKTVLQLSALRCRHDLASMYNHRIVVTNTNQGRPCSMPPCPCGGRAAKGQRLLAIGTDTLAPDQLLDLGRSLAGRQSGQEALQIRNYHWIAVWQVLSTARTNLNI